MPKIRISVGGGSLAVAQSMYAVFFGSKLNFVFGLLFSVTTLSQLATFQFIPMIYDAIKKNESGSFGIGSVLMIAGLT